MFPPLYAILDPGLIQQPVVMLAKKLSAVGVRLFQLRDKNASSRQVFAEARELVSALDPLHARLILNDRPDIASIVGSGGVHVGQEDLPVEDARRICGAGCWVGISTHNLTQLREADRTSADYIAVGPVFPTTTKENPDPVVGLDFLREARKITRKPLVAIGGITVESAPDVFRAGAESVAVIRDLLLARDPAKRAREYLDAAESVRATRT